MTDNQPQRFRKKPVEIEAMRLSPQQDVHQWDAVRLWCGGERVNKITTNVIIAIPTLEGVMEARPGDWIIRGVQGEFYPCKPDIFEATYEPAGGAS